MTNIIDFTHARAKREIEKPEIRTPLSRTHLPEFGDRLARVRLSLERINTLMAELKMISEEDVK